MKGLPRLILARDRELALAELERLSSGPFDLWEGPRGRAAKAVCDPENGGKGEAVYLAWGFCPSPLALKVLENFLDLYDGLPARRAADLESETPVPPPRVFYVCYAGTHSSILASCLHLEKVRGGCAVCDLPFFDRRTHRDIGTPVKMGHDRNGAEIYALGTGWLSRAVEVAACDLIELASPGARACLCSVRGYLDFFARVGGFASRRFGIVRLGRGLISASLTRKLPEMSKAAEFCLDLTSRWKDNVGQPKGEVIWVNGPTAGRSYRGGGARRAWGIPGPSAGRPHYLRKREDP